MFTSEMKMNKNKRATFLVAISYILMKMWMANNLYFIFCILIFTLQLC